MNLQEFITPGWIGLLITVVSFISFYLGKLVMDFYPTQEDKSLNYIVGFILFLIYIAIPALFFYYFPLLILDLNWTWFFIFWIIFGFFLLYFKIKMDVFKINRGKATSYFYEISERNLSKFGISLKENKWLKALFDGFFTKLPSQLKIILFGYITIFLVVNGIFFFNNWIIRIFIIIATISTFNNLIILHNARLIKYEDVSIRDLDNRKYYGRLIKQDNTYIILMDGKNVYRFPRENIKSIHREIKPNIKKIETIIDKIAQLFNNLIKKRLNKKKTSQQ
ncbi:MAG: hypothetical protein Q8P57_04820 [Candidatus Pacearchaeota archaeon]|nr:hypothetical protein [Candidatus Pacearchaeota archaeon]